MDDGEFDCQSCGACCVEADIARDERGSGSPMSGAPSSFGGTSRTGNGRLIRKLPTKGRCAGTPCVALEGAIGARVSCAIYDHRPDVCRTFAPGTWHCVAARHRFGIGFAQEVEPLSELTFEGRRVGGKPHGAGHVDGSPA